MYKYMLYKFGLVLKGFGMDWKWKIGENAKSRQTVLVQHIGTPEGANRTGIAYWYIPVQ